ncbi:MAG: hypothetical protein CO103_08400 [Chloroflexi bacterium CG_4_9_14_3_um_filter_45_9]|nr:MAG: hypothetical protein AUK00_01465 [Dehalococcoidia bacterium CG2_30_46_9]PIU22671.1 MAG: hypothetical protein COT13_07170 [Chloroflexi bacterium CG08_land_8_20_14_0_20_45_12]PJB47492.1 MAG: hypothetical protein CO103_08400 [Chloroflexi bacterium CG_4_9_14_3_um_filter_45_9]
MTIAEISIIPLGTKTASVSKYVAAAVKILQQEKNLKYELTAMGTIIEGDLDNILTVARKMHEAALNQGALRVVTTIKIDERRDKIQTMKDKVDSLIKELKH